LSSPVFHVLSWVVRARRSKCNHFRVDKNTKHPKRPHWVEIWMLKINPLGTSSIRYEYVWSFFLPIVLHRHKKLQFYGIKNNKIVYIIQHSHTFADMNKRKIKYTKKIIYIWASLRPNNGLCSQNSSNLPNPEYCPLIKNDHHTKDFAFERFTCYG